MPYRRGDGHTSRPYEVPQSTSRPTYRRPGDRSGVGFAAQSAPQPRDEDDRNTLNTEQAIAAPAAAKSPSPHRAPHKALPVACEVAVACTACTACGRGKDVRHACTWTVQMGEVPISYVSHDDWRQQARPERGAAPETVPEPFRGCTLDDRHPHEPKAGYSDAERQRLCPVCGTLVVHWETHAAGQLHRSKVPDRPAVPSAMDVVAALQVLQAARPDLIAAQYASASPEALLAAAGSTAHARQEQEQPRSSRWGPESRRAWTAAPTTLPDDVLPDLGHYSNAAPPARNHVQPTYVWR